MGVFSLVRAQLRQRLSRSIAMVLGLVVASAGFSLLTARTEAQSLAVQGTVDANARSAYDLLVRPNGTVSAGEESEGLVQAQFLSGIQGGISLKQLRQIRDLPGVEVAAPVAVIGYVVPKADVPALTQQPFELSGRRTLFRIRTRWHLDNGASVVKSAPRYQYVTANPLYRSRISYSPVFETGPRGRKAIGREVRVPMTESSPRPPQVDVVSRSSYRRRVFIGPWEAFTIGGIANPRMATPFLMQAIDPVAEAELSGLDEAMVEGSYLRSVTPESRRDSSRIPVIMPTVPDVQVSVTYVVDRLPVRYANQYGDGDGLAGADSARGSRMIAGRADETSTFRRFVTTLRNGDKRARSYIPQIYTVGGVEFGLDRDADGVVMVPQVVKSRPGRWGYVNSPQPDGPVVPPGGDDTQFRSMLGYQWRLDNPVNDLAPHLDPVGIFDPEALPGFSSLSQVPMGIFASAPLEGADEASREALGGEPMPFSPNVAGYAQPAPLLLTSLNSLPLFQTDPGGWARMPANGTGTPFAPVKDAPLSSIRIRVGDVTGVDDLSRERVRLVAQRIRDTTGLQVDITLGSSPSPQRIDLAAGQYGRPQLQLQENWVKKGVALVILKAVDKKSLALFLLVLLTCALFIANAATASVQARRSELGILACLGWAPGRLFGLIATELALLAATAGLVGAAVALLAGDLVGLPVGLGRALLAVPAALLIVLVSGFLPARLAAKAPPMEAARRSVRAPKRAASPASVTGLAWTNLRRVPQRAILAGIALAVAVTALVLITGIQSAFDGAVVGSLLGDAVTVQVRGADVAAVAGICVLAGIGIANVTYLSLRERAAELATLRALGWTDVTLARLLLIEATMIGIAAASVGAAVGVAGLTYGLGLPIGELTTISAQLWIAGIIVAPLAALVPALTINRLDTVTVLSEDF